MQEAQDFNAVMRVDVPVGRDEGVLDIHQLPDTRDLGGAPHGGERLKVPELGEKSIDHLPGAFLPHQVGVELEDSAEITFGLCGQLDP